MHIVYIIESESTDGWYIGYTTNLQKRLNYHNGNQNVSTAHKGPWKLIYCEAYVEKKDALGVDVEQKQKALLRGLLSTAEGSPCVQYRPIRM